MKKAPFKAVPVLLLFLFWGLGLGLNSCANNEPLKIGFVGGLTGRGADLGIAGRDGVTLAVEDQNRAGGIEGRKIILVSRDDKQDPEAAVQADHELINEGVVAIVGHMTSAMSMIAVPVINKAKVLMISPTTSTNELCNLDDYFFRVYPASANAAHKLADHIFKSAGIAGVTVLYDLRNRSYTENWFVNFKEEFEKLGGRIIGAHTFESSPKVQFMDLARQITYQKTGCLLILANAMDTAMLCQQLAKLDWHEPIFASEWSATDDVLGYGGPAVEGLSFFHTFDKDNSNPEYVRFRKNFISRFGHEPGFAASHAYDAAQVLFAALEKNQNPAFLKQNILAMQTFAGLQGAITFDKTGDVYRDHFFVTVKNGRFVIVKNQ